MSGLAEASLGRIAGLAILTIATIAIGGDLSVRFEAAINDSDKWDKLQAEIHSGRLQLREHASSSTGPLAVAAQWQGTLERLRQSSVSSSETVLARFTGFVEATARLPVPSWWEKSIASGKLSRESGFELNYSDDSLAALPKSFQWAAPDGEEAQISGCNRIGLKNRTLEVQTNKMRWNAGSFERYKSLIAEGKTSISFASDETLGFVLCISPIDGGGDLFIIGHDGSLVRKIGVFGANWRRGGISGGWTATAEIRVKDGVVGIFGRTLHGNYLETFSVASGKVALRFCTKYWSQRATK